MGLYSSNDDDRTDNKWKNFYSVLAKHSLYNRRILSKMERADMIRLYNSRPNESAEAMSKCTSFPFNVDKGV